MQKIIKVNGRVVPQEAIQHELERLVRFHAEHGMSQDQIRAQLPDLIGKATEQAIGARLLMDEASRQAITVSDDELDAEVARIVDQVGGAEAFKRALAQQNTSESDFREQLRQGRRVDKLVSQITEGVAEPEESELEEYFNGHRDDYVQAERVLAQHILITPDGDTPASKDEAHAKITAIRERVMEGAEFADEAARHSMCPSGQEGGGLGWFARGMMVPEFDQTVFSMKVGEVSEIVETQFGYHIIYKADEESASALSFEEARDKVRDFLRHARRGAAVGAFVEQLKDGARIEMS